MKRMGMGKGKMPHPGKRLPGNPPGPDFNLREGLRAAAPRGRPKPPRSSTAGYRRRLPSMGA